ncbi:Gamma-glutamyltranspeptidase @ Glutathione hydrolase [hydrothermal vent metagenome]|uniref:Gamma-glutamyltranspeptidase @ Glutathione hydrolase n=1 Tax=hydrothermal vent metagenome TaxID=652676 RepID=A0A3B0S7U9_9ZZZZ
MKNIFTFCFIIFVGLALSGCSKSGPAMVSTANPHASRAAAEMLEKGGSAMDAAIAAQLVLGLVEPQSSGIGGGAFALYFKADRSELTSFDGREKAPGQADETLFLNDEAKPISWNQASIGGRAVGVPGVVALSWKAHQKFGRLSWPQLFEPAIRLAEQGFSVSPRLSQALTRSQDDLKRDFGARQLYFSDRSLEPLAVGAIFKNPAYAKTLKIIAEKGPDGFYRGPVAQAIVDAVQNHPGNSGLITLDDLKAYEAIERQAICSPYRGYRVCGMPPPTSGGLTSLMILGMLEPYNLANMDAGSATAMHLFTQASRLAYADRALYMADADFVDVPVAGLLDKNYLRKRAALINPLADTGKAKAGQLPLSTKKATSLSIPEYGTSHISIVDKQGNAISMTTSVERAFGSHMVAGGFVLNSQLTDFSFVPELNGMKVANRVEAGKRPRSSMSPTLVFAPDGSLFAAIGSPGGSRIIEFVSRTLIGLIDWQLPMQAAIDLGNVNNRNQITELEAGTSAQGFAGYFESMGHKIQIKPLVSGLHGIRITPAGMDGGADRRREGLVIKLGR